MPTVYPYTLKRSKRASIAIHITKEATVEVRAPLKMAKHDIDAFVASKSSWIASHLQIMSERVAQKSRFALDYGDTVLYHGRACPIVAREGEEIGFDPATEAFYLPPNYGADAIKASIIAVYKLLAKRDFPSIVQRFAPIMGVHPKSVKVNSATTRWGSCSSAGNLNFSWRLIMADTPTIDYVVIHELSHLKEMNHSPRFWSVVAQHCPSYQDRQGDLKDLQRILTAQNWTLP